MNKRMKFEIRESSKNHLVIDFISYGGYLGFIDIWKNGTIYTDNIINGLDINRSKQILKITKKLWLLNRIGIIKKG